MAQLTVTNVCHSFGFEEVLKDISFSLKQGGVVSIVGPSGSGKTTLLRLCAGLLEIDKGKITNNFNHSTSAFQESRLLPWKNVIDNIALGLKGMGINKKERQKKAKEISLRFGLEEQDFNKFPKDLSGGMKQRVSFARALVVKPDLLFLDEPFSALDIGLKRELQTILIELINKREISVLFITHDLMEAIKLSDEVILLKADPGRIATRFFYNKPQSERDDAFVYRESALLLSQPDVMTTFELELTK